jgi:Flp pilus assembly pilin Flp
MHLREMGALAQRAIERALARIGRWVGWSLGNEKGQSAVEYLLIVGACALVGVAGFSKYGAALKRDLGANAKHIEGEGLPNIESTLGVLGADYNETPGWCVKPNYCFAAGTPVQTGRGDRPIESIAVGERVWARDVTTGAIALRTVVNRYRTPGVKVVDLELSSAFDRRERVAVTPGHLFWIEGAGWTRADALSAQPLWSVEARLSAQVVSRSEQPVTVYNLEVADFHSYFVGRSHVLVHNGDPASSGCAMGSTGSTEATTESSPPAPGSKLQCGESGLYADLGGGARPTIARESNGMERDHVPSGKALAVRTAELIKERAEAEMAAKCRDLTPDEKDALAAKVTEMVEDASSPKPLLAAVKSKTMTVAVPLPLHKAGRTYFGKNQDKIGPNQEKRYEVDSWDLAAAAEADIAEYERLLGIDGKAPEYTGNDVDAACKAKILAALNESRKKSKADYDAELAPIAQARLDELGFSAAIDDKCGGATKASQ